MSPLMRGPMRAGHAYFAGHPLLIAHRGGAGLGPENTLEAFDRSLHEWRADILEIDVRPTLEGEVVILHDPTVDRTTDGSGPVAELPLARIRELDAGHRFSADAGKSFPFRGRGVRIPTLHEALTRFPDARFNIEIKDPRAQGEVRSVIDRCGAWGRVLIAAEKLRSRVAFIRDAVAVSASRRQLWLAFVGARIGAGRWIMPPVDALQSPDTYRGIRPVDARLVRAAHARNIAVHVWTVNEESRMRELLGVGVDGIMTDRPDRLARVLHEVAGRPLPRAA